MSAKYARTHALCRGAQHTYTARECARILLKKNPYDSNSKKIHRYQPLPDPLSPRKYRFPHIHAALFSSQTHPSPSNRPLVTRNQRFRIYSKPSNPLFSLSLCGAPSAPLVCARSLSINIKVCMRVCIHVVCDLD